MTNPTNWPNPEQPSVPMFPERDGWHFLAGVLYPDFWMMDLWNAGTKSWGNGSMLPDLAATRCVYGGPVRNPTQIAELLAGERERCAKLLEDAYEKTGKDFEYLGCLSCADEIRNPGAAL